MKKVALIVALLLAVPLTACGAGQWLPSSAPAAVAAVTKTSNTQQHALAAASNAYVILANGVTAYAKTAKPSSDVKAKLSELNDKIHATLVAARTANARGDSPALAAALEQVKPQVAELQRYLLALGISLPAIPAL